MGPAALLVSMVVAVRIAAPVEASPVAESARPYVRDVAAVAEVDQLVRAGEATHVQVDPWKFVVRAASTVGVQVSGAEPLVGASSAPKVQCDGGDMWRLEASKRELAVLEAGMPSRIMAPLFSGAF